MAHTLPMLELTEPVAPPRDCLVGTRLNGFVITGTLSVGGMGVVYEARHCVLGRRAAVKVIRPELCNDPELTARFLREALAVSAVKHRNIVEILDFGALPDGAQYMMMEFLEGETLAQIIARDAPMQPIDALRICQEILSGLDAAHQVGVVHRDLKPANIVLMRQSSGELIVKVLDFGLARHLDTAPEPTTRESLQVLSREKSSLLAGTPEYISPEQAGGAQVGAQGDLYAVGVILYEMLSGRLPFTATSPWELMQQHKLIKPPALSVMAAGIHPQLNDLVMRMLEKDPADRPLGAKAAASEITKLQPLFSGALIADTLVFSRVRPPRRLRARFVAFATVGVAASLIAFTLNSSAAAPTSNSDAPTAAPAAVTSKWVAPSLPEPTLTPVTTVAVRPTRPRAVAPVSPASPTCEVSDSWKRGIREQIEDLEKLSLARMKDDAPPSEVARIKQKTRALAMTLRTAQGSQCRQVEADLKAWRMALR